MPKNDVPSKYQQIALDIAQRIVNKSFIVGNKIYGRSLLASMYKVSPETIRKAVALLQDMNVLIVNQGSGITIKSIENAYNFIQRFKFVDSINSLKHELEDLIIAKKKIDIELENKLNKIIDFSDNLKNLSPYNPVEVDVTENCKHIGKTISELKFWQNTGGTIVALRKGNDFIISPGPYAVLEKDNVIVVVGGQDILKDVERFING